MREGVSTAEWLNELGYTCFVLRYRIGDQATDNAPLEDVSRAVRYITEYAEQFHVQPEDYAVLAYSSGRGRSPACLLPIPTRWATRPMA